VGGSRFGSLLTLVFLLDALLFFSGCEELDVNPESFSLPDTSANAV